MPETFPQLAHLLPPVSPSKSLQMKVLALRFQRIPGTISIPSTNPNGLSLPLGWW